jgi:hypothetical protein
LDVRVTDLVRSLAMEQARHPDRGQNLPDAKVLSSGNMTPRAS